MTVGELREALLYLDEDLPVLVTEYGGIGLVEVANVEENTYSYSPSVVIS